jgi:hypothetical protein
MNFATGLDRCNSGAAQSYSLRYLRNCGTLVVVNTECNRVRQVKPKGFVRRAGALWPVERGLAHVEWLALFNLRRRGAHAMDKNLEYLIEWAKKHHICEEESKAQVRSFAYGNTHFENNRITKTDIDDAMDKLDKERVSNPVCS